jgi:hypothetical protein
MIFALQMYNQRTSLARMDPKIDYKAKLISEEIGTSVERT